MTDAGSGSTGRTQRRRVGFQARRKELVDPDGAVEVLQPVLAQIAKLDAGEVVCVVLEERDGRLRDQDLPAVSHCAQSRGPVDCEADVAPVGDLGRAGVEADPHAQLGAGRPRMLPQRPLGGDRGEHPVARAAKRGEERVSLRIDLVPAVGGEGLAQEPLVLGEDGPVLVAELPEQPRRSLDVAGRRRSASLSAAPASAAVSHRAEANVCSILPA